jgi:hypothetical protein
MISTIHDATIVNKGRKTDMEIKKPYVVGQYNKFIKDIGQNQYLSFYSFLEKTVKWSKKVVLYVLNCVLCNTFFVQDTKYKQRKVQELPARGRKVLLIRSPESK